LEVASLKKDVKEKGKEKKHTCNAGQGNTHGETSGFRAEKGGLREVLEWVQRT